MLEYSENYSMTSGSLWNYSRDEVNDAANENDDADNYRINSKKTQTSKSFEYMTKIIGKTPDNNSRLDTVFVPLKYLPNFWISIDLSLINYKIELDLSWSTNCIISETSRTHEAASNPGANPPVLDRDTTLTTKAIFQLNIAKLYVSVVTLSINNNIKFLEYLKQGFKRTISWKKYRSEITTHSKNSKLD